MPSTVERPVALRMRRTQACEGIGDDGRTTWHERIVTLKHMQADEPGLCTLAIAGQVERSAPDMNYTDKARSPSCCPDPHAGRPTDDQRIRWPIGRRWTVPRGSRAGLMIPTLYGERADVQLWWPTCAPAARAAPPSDFPARRDPTGDSWVNTESGGPSLWPPTGASPSTYRRRSSSLKT